MNGAVAMVGFMGAGKSSLAAIVGRTLGLPWIDTDAVIEADNGPISDIFAHEGEVAFRALERTVVCEALRAAAGRPTVLALGGGAVTSDDVREALSRLTHVVWVDAAVDLLFERASRGGRRPLANDRAAFEQLYEERRPLYEEVASAVVFVSRGEGRDSVARRIVEAVS